MLAEKVCRVCLSECDELTPLWVKLPGGNRTLEETINFVVNINIKLADGLPDKMCKICESILDMADNFKKRCLESESILGQQAQKKQNDESQPKCERNHQENSEIHSDDTSCLPSSISHTSVTDSLREITENIYDLPEHKIKMEIEEHHVDAEVTISAQEPLDSIQDFQTSPAKSNEPCLIKEEVSEKNMKHSDNKEMFCCPHCGQTFRTKISYKVHILCSCEPKDLKIILYKCALCKETFSSKDSFEAHLTTHRSQKNSDRNGQLTLSSGGDNQHVLFLSEELHQGEDTTDHPCPLAPHQPDEPSPKEPKLDDMQPTTAAVRSPTEDPAAADTSTNTIIETEANCDKAEISGLIKRKKNVKNINLKQKGGKRIGKGKKDKESTKDTATVLKLSGTNTDDKITCATEAQSNRFNYTVIGATGFIRTCGICGYTTATVRYLNAHLKAHAATKRYSCDSCLYLTVNLVHFNRHLRSHTDADDKPFSCDECKKKFSLRTNLVAHLKTHTGDKPYSCDMCEKNFAQKSYLVKHTRKHSDERPYSCDVCDRKFSCKDYVVAHVNTHSGLTPYSCVVCGKKFNSKNYLNQHVRTHTGKRPYSCDICDMKFIRKKSFEGHISNHTGIMPYSCDVCKMKFIRKSYLIKHVRIHTGEKPYSCDVCQKKFVQKHYLVAHRRTHTGVRPYSCDVCDKKFFQKKYLNIHLKTHTGEKPYSCDICGMKFLRKSNLVAHVSTHTGNKPYSCDVCEMKFIHKYHLNRHIARIHTGEKPFSCNVCKKKFSQRANLDRHLKTHTGEKPYSCDVCQKKFVLKDYLDVHRRTHTGVRPYSCNVCDMKFFEKKSLNRHLKTHTGEKPYSCDMCERKFIEKYNLLNHVRKTHS